MNDTKTIERCGVLGIIMMLILGPLFGTIGVILAHVIIKFYGQYYLCLIMPLLMAWLLGLGLSVAARIGRCTRLNLIAVLLILLASAACYGGLLFLNDYHDQQAPPTIVDEAFWLIEDGQNFLHNLPYVGDYVPPAADTEREAQHLGAALADFFERFFDLAEGPLVVGQIFDLALMTPVRHYLIHPGITAWLPAANDDGEQIRAHGQLILSQNFASAWMLWSVELLLVFVVALVMARGGAKRALRTRVKKFQKAGLNVDPHHTPSGKPAKQKAQAKRAKTAVIEDVDIPSAAEDEAAAAGAEPAKGKKKKAKPPKPPKEKKIKPPKEKTGLFGLGRKKKPAESEREAEESDAGDLDRAGEPALYALVLHQYNPARESDLVQLIQQVGQLSPDKARRLLKVPSLLKRDVSAQDAKAAIDTFNQVQAQVKLITMEQLLQIQQKQQGATAPPPPQAPPAPPQAPAGSPGDHYALILKRIEPTRQREILELLSSLSGKPADQLLHTLKPPALVLRDATRDEVMMIAQQFHNLQAEVQSLTMTQLQQLMAKNKK
jgi:hypothetical protein